ncbi:MAG: multicopper oxidase family protein [Candidatus Limnocylindrales bacterium]
MDTIATPPPSEPTDLDPGLTRRRFLQASALTGGGLVVATLAACAPALAPAWTPPPSPSGSGSGSVGAQATGHDHGNATPETSPTAAPTTAAPSGSSGASAGTAATIPAGWGQHDVDAKAAVDRFLGGEYTKLDQTLPNAPLAYTMDGSTKVFQLTVDEITHRTDAVSPPVQALGFNASWTGPLLRVAEGERLRATFQNNLHETTGIHFHGQALPNAMDGVPFITQPPIVPGASFTYEFTAGPFGSHMYHSHHNATDQVGRGLLGAFIVDPADASQRYDRKYGVTQEVIWISNDQLGGFTINGRQFPATAPIVAKLGERVLVRFMNEGVMTHPWHLHGTHFQVLARDGYPLGSAAFRCDTLGVNPGERYDVLIDCDNPGAWAFHCHILPHAEGMHGMFGMVTALIIS